MNPSLIFIIGLMRCNLIDSVLQIIVKKILSMRSRINLLLFYSINYKLNREYNKYQAVK